MDISELGQRRPLTGQETSLLRGSVNPVIYSVYSEDNNKCGLLWSAHPTS